MENLPLACQQPMTFQCKPIPKDTKGRNTEMTIEMLFIAVLIGVIPATIAKAKGRSFIGWWIYGAALFIIALPHSLIMNTDSKLLDKQKLAEGMKKCPHCAEIIKGDAKVCRYCGRDILNQSNAATS